MWQDSDDCQCYAIDIRIPIGNPNKYLIGASKHLHQII